MKKTRSKTAQFLEQAIDRSGKTQTQIAREAGLTRPNVLSMMKKGETKVPLPRIPRLAMACGADAVYFLRLALEEYHPEMFDLLVSTLGESLTEDEWQIIDIYRTASRGRGILLDTEAKLRLTFLLAEISEKQNKGKWPPKRS